MQNKIKLRDQNLPHKKLALHDSSESLLQTDRGSFLPITPSEIFLHLPHPPAARSAFFSL